MTTSTIDLNAEQAKKKGALIGPKGSILKGMQAESGAKIDVGDGKVEITGTDEQVAAATALVNAILSPPFAELTTDADHARLLIGPKGSTLKQLQEDAGGAKINVDRDAGTVRIEGKSQAIVDKALALVKAITEPLFEEVECTKVAVSHVVGPGAGTIKKLKEETGATVLIVEGEPACKVRVEGTEEQIAACVARVKKILEEQANPDYAGPEGGALRTEAEAFAQERSRLHDEANAAYEAGDKDGARALREQASAAGESMKSKNAEAATVIVAHRNAVALEQDPGLDIAGYLDLHGLQVAEAVAATEAKLDELAAASAAAGGAEQPLWLMPGAGHHSGAGGPAIKPACEELLKARGIRFENRDAGSWNVWVTLAGLGAAGAATAADALAAVKEAEEEEAPVPAPAEPAAEPVAEPVAKPAAEPAAEPAAAVVIAAEPVEEADTDGSAATPAPPANAPAAPTLALAPVSLPPVSLPPAPAVAPKAAGQLTCKEYHMPDPEGFCPGMFLGAGLANCKANIPKVIDFAKGLTAKSDESAGEDFNLMALCQNPMLCLDTFLGCCWCSRCAITSRAMAPVTGRSCEEQCATDCLTGCVPCLGCCYGPMSLGQARHKYGIAGNNQTDCALGCCCGCCVVADLAVRAGNFPGDIPKAPTTQAVDRS